MRRLAHSLAAAAALSAGLAVVMGPASVARAHELRPGLLSLVQTGPAEYDVVLRVPLEAAVSETPTVILPVEAARLDRGSRTPGGGWVEEKFRVHIVGGFSGRRVGLRFQGGGAASEVLVRVVTDGGRTLTGRLLPSRPGGSGREAIWIVPTAPGALAVGGTYLRLGVEHILTGLDHLAFVLGLILLTPAWRQVCKTVTAFTVAHSVTLALAALGLVRVPQPPIEAAIALSILLVARELWLREREGERNPERERLPGGTAPAIHRPWVMAFVFGLLHGLGFAGALAEVGLPQSDLALALLTFNLGVELGQLAFVMVVLGAGRMLAHRSWARRRWLRRAPAYAIGTLAAYWCLDRVAGFWS